MPRTSTVEPILPDRLRDLLGSPTQWAGLLMAMEITGHDDEETATNSRIGLLLVLSEIAVDSEDWNTLSTSDFMMTIARLILNVCFCGHDKAQLTAPEGLSETAMIRIICLLKYMAILMDRFLDQTSPLSFKQQQCLDLLASATPRLWKLLWEIRTPFFEHQSANLQQYGLLDDDLYGVIYLCSYITSDVLAKFKGLTYHWSSSYMPYLWLVVWIHGRREPERIAALQRLIVLFNDVPDEQYAAFYCDHARAAYTGITSHPHVLRAALRDLRNENIVDHPLYSVIQAATRFRSAPSPASIAEQYDTDMQKQVIWAQLGACRRQLCRGISSESETPYHLVMFRGADSMVFLFSALLQERPRLVIFERHIHSFFSILAPRVVSTLVGCTDPSEIKRLPEALEICYQLLRNCLANQEPRHRPDDIYIIREHSSITWRAFSSKINQALRSIDQSTENRAIFQHWAEIGRLLDSVEPEGQVAYCFPPVKRCGWELCPCSVHHPAHCLRVCKGCWTVAYCNASCQQSAWTEGGHRNICSGNRGRGSEISAAI